MAKNSKKANVIEAVWEEREKHWGGGSGEMLEPDEAGSDEVGKLAVQSGVFSELCELVSSWIKYWWLI